MTPTPDTTARTETAETVTASVPVEPTEDMRIAGEEAYWSAPKDEDRCTAMAAAYRAMIAAAQAVDPTPHALQDRLHGMLKMAVASEDSFNRLSPAGRRLIREAEGFFASSREDRDDLNACWDALQAETKRADAAEARLVALASPHHPVGVREALEAARPIVEADMDAGEALGDAEWERQSRDVLEKIDASLAHPPAQDAPGAVDRYWSCSCGHVMRYTPAELAEHGEPDECSKCCRERLEEIEAPAALDPSPPLPEADGEVVAWAKPREPWVMGQQFMWADERTEDWMKNLFTEPLVRQSALVSALRERDEARAKADRLSKDAPESFTEVGELLAVIHRDGGHYEAQHGYLKAVKDAETVVLADRAAREKAEQVAAGLREAVKRGYQGWSNAIELRLLPTQHVRSAEELRDLFGTALRASTEEGKTATPPVKDEEAAQGVAPVAWIVREALEMLQRDKTATATVCSPLLKKPFGVESMVRLYAAIPPVKDAEARRG